MKFFIAAMSFLIGICGSFSYVQSAQMEFEKDTVFITQCVAQAWVSGDKEISTMSLLPGGVAGTRLYKLVFNNNDPSPKVIRLMTGHYEKTRKRCETEIDVMRCAEKAGVGPRLYATGITDDMGWAIMEYITAVPDEKVPWETQELSEKLGLFLKKMSSYESSIDTEKEYGLTTIIPVRMESILKKIQEKNRVKAWNIFVPFIDKLEQRMPLIAQQKRTRLGHGDLHRQNLLFSMDAEGNLLVDGVDWDHSIFYKKMRYFDAGTLDLYYNKKSDRDSFFRQFLTDKDLENKKIMASFNIMKTLATLNSGIAYADVVPNEAIDYVSECQEKIKNGDKGFLAASVRAIMKSGFPRKTRADFAHFAGACLAKAHKNFSSPEKWDLWMETIDGDLED